MDLSKNHEAPDPSISILKDHDAREFSDSHTGLESLLSNFEGYIVGRIGDELLRFRTDAHFLTVSPTGGGKTTGCIIPNLLDHPGSSFVIDIRGETVAKTANVKRLQGHKVVVLDPYDLTKGRFGKDRYNPLDRITNEPTDLTSDDRIQRLVSAIMFDPEGRTSKEPIWDNATKNFLSSLISVVVRYFPPYRHSLIEILDILNYSPQELDSFTAELMMITSTIDEAQNDRQIKTLLKMLTEGKTATKITDNAIIQAQSVLTWAGYKSFQDILTFSTFSFDELQTRKMTVYLVVPEEFISSCASWTRIMIESAIFSLKDVHAEKGVHTSSLSQEERVLFLLDELPAFGQLDVVSKGMATLRGRGINLWLFIQNLAQLDDIYGEKTARTIIGNAAVLQAFKSSELEELEYFAKLIGEEFFDVQSVSIGETITEGKSLAKGISKTISNSESISNTIGSSDSYSESVGENWSDTEGTSDSRTISKGFSNSSGTSSNEGYSHNRNKGNNSNFERNLVSSTKKGFSSSRGNSSGRNYGSGKNQSVSSNKSFSKSSSSNNSHTIGGNSNNSVSHSRNESFTTSNQRGKSETTSDTVTENNSTAANRSISVKKERIKIETVRSLREKMSDRNQLIQIRGHHPFFAPRMSYFVKYRDKDHYMFPDMAVLVEMTILDDMLQKLESLTSIISNTPSVSDLKSEWKKLNALPKNELDQKILEIQNILNNLIPNVLDSYLLIKPDLFNRENSISDQPYIALASITALLRDYGHIESVSELEKRTEQIGQLIESLDTFNLEEESYINYKMYDYSKALQFKTVENQLAFGNLNSNITLDDKMWFVQTYTSVIRELLDAIIKFAEPAIAQFSQLQELVSEASIVSKLHEKAFSDALSEIQY